MQAFQANRSGFPVYASILENLSGGYKEDGKRMDEEGERRKLEH
jgi:hypothetical protein